MAKPIREFPLKDDESIEQKGPWFDSQEIFCLGSEFFKNILGGTTKGSLIFVVYAVQNVNVFISISDENK